MALPTDLWERIAQLADVPALAALRCTCRSLAGLDQSRFAAAAAVAHNQRVLRQLIEQGLAIVNAGKVAHDDVSNSQIRWLPANPGAAWYAVGQRAALAAARAFGWQLRQEYGEDEEYEESAISSGIVRLAGGEPLRASVYISGGAGDFDAPCFAFHAGVTGTCAVPACLHTGRLHVGTCAP